MGRVEDLEPERAQQEAQHNGEQHQHRGIDIELQPPRAAGTAPLPQLLRRVLWQVKLEGGPAVLRTAAVDQAACDALLGRVYRYVLACVCVCGCVCVGGVIASGEAAYRVALIGPEGCVIGWDVGGWGGGGGGGGEEAGLGERRRKSETQAPGRDLSVCVVVVGGGGGMQAIPGACTPSKPECQRPYSPDQGDAVRSLREAPTPGVPGRCLHYAAADAVRQAGGCTLTHVHPRVGAPCSRICIPSPPHPTLLPASSPNPTASMMHPLFLSRTHVPAHPIDPQAHPIDPNPSPNPSTPRHTLNVLSTFASTLDAEGRGGLCLPPTHHEAGLGLAGQLVQCFKALEGMLCGRLKLERWGRGGRGTPITTSAALHVMHPSTSPLLCARRQEVLNSVAICVTWGVGPLSPTVAVFVKAIKHSLQGAAAHSPVGGPPAAPLPPPLALS
jgi:hypothetical protein